MTLQEKLEGKKILLLSVQTFNYEILIANQLRKFGVHVDYYDERPVNSFFAKGIIRLKRSIYQKRIDKYYKRILKDTAPVNYDYLFVIRGEVVPAFFLKEFKKQNSECFFLFYTWDAFSNHTHPISILKYFDKCFTFDSNDAIKYQINFRPLFYIEKYGELNNLSFTEYKYNLLFIGTAHSDRYIISNDIVNWCNSHDLNSFTYYFMHGRLVFLFKKFFDSSFKNFDYKKLRFKSLTIDEILDLYKKSAVILDINHPGQIALTMRTFEALGAGKKIITTNNVIKKYPFYNENNVYIIDRKNPILELDFFQTPFLPITGELRNKMSLNGWLDELFSEEKVNYWNDVIVNS